MNADAGDAVPSRRGNNFDALRLFAAVVVLGSHSYPLTGHGLDDIFTNSLFGYDLGGSFAVLIFFAISGFLVTKSAVERSAADYLVARALRILPALVVAVFATVFIIGPLLTPATLAAYFADQFTLPYLKNIFVFGVSHHLPMATRGLPYEAINSSLWTLSLECGFYVILIWIAQMGLLSRRLAWIAPLAMVALYFWCIFIGGMNWGSQGPTIWKGVTLYEVTKNGCAFFLGGTIWVYRDRIPITTPVAIAFCIALFAAAGTASAPVVYTFALPYLVIYAALALPAINTAKVGDLSYATYLLAFPIQQLVIRWIGANSPTSVSLLTIAIVLPLAYLSWWYVERPFLSFKKRREPAATPEATEVIRPRRVAR